MKKLLLILALLLTLPLSSCNANEFTLVYGNIQWGDEVIDNSYDYYISDIPEKDGFNFDGWYEDIDYTKPITKVSAGTKGDIVIFAKFSK